MVNIVGMQSEPERWLTRPNGLCAAVRAGETATMGTPTSKSSGQAIRT